ncbi:4Fe-4S dicluster domain-containing protein [Gordonibacter massiliensis (ex Traore et al. 2017)]|uniref:4Fe-4S dicluster domain-containing protein n=1 Tax=Gordonibacter massiliensis (ex Traore et al. 2017) TaxID=1841863 RepID=UPI001C8C7F2C|nr:4Fe-4S dicluster domain-containing protein [Gordonibacter massiliensis (ex Traore et al. 2017)]
MRGAYPTSRKLVIADPGTCIGCKTCMAACLMRHDVPNDVPVPRLTLVTTRTISAPVGCHHCAEAPCADACPTGCLYTDDEHVGVHPDKCIGCRNCVLACPYGAVDIVTRPAPPEPEAASEQVPATCAAEEAKAPKPSARDRAKAKKRRRKLSTVVKCDLCVDHADGPACVAACPTKALRLIDPQMLERGKQAKRKAAARAAAAYSTIELNADLDEGE